MALHGEGDFTSGEWCRFCKAKAVCRKRAEENLSLARYDFARPDFLEDDEINLILGKIDPLKKWTEDVKEYALYRALGGFVWDDWKLVEGRTNRKFSDEETVPKIVEDAGFDPYEKKLRTLTGIENLLGKKKFSELLEDFIIKPKESPTLVPRTDKRAEIEAPNLKEIFS